MVQFCATSPNFYWDGDFFLPPFEPRTAADCLTLVQKMTGQFSFAHNNGEGRVFLVRDRLGLNKLFFALHQSGRVIAANCLIDLVGKGIPLEAIFSVPAGHFVEIDFGGPGLYVHQYFKLNSESEQQSVSIEVLGQAIREQIELWVSRIKRAVGDRRILLCLSGGLDSGLVAAFISRDFDNVMAYTYGFYRDGDTQSEDVSYAVQLANCLGIPMRIVQGCSQDILSVVRTALCYGQDWRDFNVHCAIVNAILGQAMQMDVMGVAQRPLVITGDLMNEFLVDYSPVVYDRREYYPLPKIGIESLRRFLIRGLDAGDREIGVFSHYGIEVIQPYNLLLESYLTVPPSYLSDPDFKPRLVRQIAGDLLPRFIFERVKVRAQIGTSAQPHGILPILIDSGHDAAWMKKTFCEIFAAEDDRVLNRFIRTGLYRSIHEFPKGNERANGYYLA